MMMLDSFNSNVKIFFLLFFLGIIVSVSEVFSQSPNSYKDTLQCEYLAKDAEKRYGLPENILLSISRVESGYKRVDGVTRAWPWTLNAGGDSAYFQTKENALGSLKERVKKGVTNIDIGCMQINYRWHKKFFKDLSDMISPSKNVDYGARFLKRLYQRHGSWEKAVKYYHSSKNKFNIKYYKKVKAVWARENNEASLKPRLVAAVFSPEKITPSILKKKEKTMPLIELDNTNRDPYNKKLDLNEVGLEEDNSIIFTTANFQKRVDTGTEFDFNSFVKSVSQKNTALPKYIRDNWTIVLSIKNQLGMDD